MESTHSTWPCRGPAVVAGSGLGLVIFYGGSAKAIQTLWR